MKLANVERRVAEFFAANPGTRPTVGELAAFVYWLDDGEEPTYVESLKVRRALLRLELKAMPPSPSTIKYKRGFMVVCITPERKPRERRPRQL